jgi:tetratricopeptide (TPR) repeat protein
MAGIESLLIGRVLGGRYRIEEVIGRGGMGAVYRATDERLGRQVALKVITVPGAGDAEARDRLRARFFREARSAAALPHHPNVVPVYDYGSDEALSLDYIVMELLRGSDLASRLARSATMPLSAGLKILIEASRGVAIGHRQGLIHRDIKPGNIFLTETDSGEVQVRVVDFGIAKLADEEDTLAQLTQDGRVPHSPAYASPEQLRGLSQLKPASDVFSLGAVGYQLLTGERPFTDSDRNKLSLGMPVDVPSVRGRNPAVPAAVDQVIGRALAFDPEDRFPDAGAMAAELEKAVRSITDAPLDPYLAGAPIVSAVEQEARRDGAEADDDRTQLADFDDDDRTLLAPAPPPAGRHTRGDRPFPPRTPLPPRRQTEARRGVGGILVWGLVLLVLAAAGIWGWREMQRSPDFALEFPPMPDTIPEILVDDTLPDPEQPTELDAFINHQDGIQMLNRGELVPALAAFQRAVQLAPDNPDYRYNYALTYLRLRLFDEAAEEFQRVLQLDPNRPAAYYNLAQAQLAMGDTTAAINALQQHVAREARPRERGIAERELRTLQAAQEAAGPPLLGEPLPPQTDPDPAGAVPGAAARPGPGL